MRPRKKLETQPADETKFDKPTMLKILKDLQTGRLPLPRVQISDDKVTGLRAMINRGGTKQNPGGSIALHAAYAVGGSRPLVKLGELQDGAEEPITIDEARELTVVIQELGEKGVDVQEGLHRRLMTELRRDGANWRPNLAPVPAKKVTKGK
jgi:hypothetical protein